MTATSLDLSQIRTDAISAASTFRTLIGLGTLATQNGTISDYLTILSAASTYQPLDSDLTSIAALTTTTYGRSLLTQADASATRTTLGLGTLATQSPTGTPSASNFLRGDYSWQTIDLSNYLPLSGGTLTGLLTTPRITLSGNISAAAWTTTGIGIGHVARTITDTSSSGTVATAYTNVIGGNTIAASNSTTFTDYASLQVGQPTSGTNVTFTNRWAVDLGGAIRSSGYSLTGSQAQSLVDLSGTWNTTGTPTLIKANVTDTASNASSLLMDLQVGGSSKFKISKGGGLTGTTATLSATLDLTIRTVTYGATMAIDASLGNKIAITLTGNGTISNPTNAVDGRVLVFRLRQDGSGNRVPVWDTKYSFVGDLATVTLSTAANKIDRIAFEYDSTDDKWYCISFIKGS